LRLLLPLLLLLLGSQAVAHTGEHAELTNLQRVAGYVTLLGIAKILGASLIAGGIIAMTWGVLSKVLYEMRVVLEILTYVVSIGLMASGLWIENPEHLTWTVFIGCILFGFCTTATIWIHKIPGEDPKGLASFLMVIWGLVAVLYTMPEVGFLSVMALMTVLGFSVVVSPFCYAFGFSSDKQIPSGTSAGLLLLSVYVGLHIFVPDTPTTIEVFKPGVFWISSFVAFIGLLILSSKWWARGSQYATMQIITIVVYGVALAAGLVFGINPLAGMAGTFLVFYLAAKPMEIPTDSMVGFGFKLLIIGGILFIAWTLAMRNFDLVSTYLTTQF